CQSAGELGRLGDARALPALVGLLQDADAEVAGAAADAPLPQGPAALEPPGAGLRPGGAAAPRFAEVLGRLADGRAANAVLDAIKCGAGALRAQAARALAALDPPDWAVLVTALADDYPYVRRTAAEVLAGFGPVAVPALAAALGRGEPALRP